jgi:hypothetical protein
MTNILKKPYTNKEYAQFAALANENGQCVELTKYAAFALNQDEKVVNSRIVKRKG